MTTAEIYERWKLKGGKPPSLVCCKTGVDIIDDIEGLENRAKNSDYNSKLLMYYMLYLSTVQPEESLCHNEYQRTIARDFEKQQRKEFLNPTNTDIYEDYNKMLNIPKRFWKATFATTQREPQQDKMVEKINTFIQGGYKDTLLLSTPQSGFGKTHFQVCITKQFFIEYDNNTYKRFNNSKWSQFDIFNTDILFTTELQLYNLMRRTFEGTTSEDKCPFSEQQVYDVLNSMKLLVISDCFQDGNPLKKRMMTTIIESRVEEECKNLVLSTNMQINSISRSLSYIYSRLSRGLIFATTGKEGLVTDLRKKYR